MTIEIPTSEMEAMAYACAHNELNHKFFPTELTGIIKVRVTDKGKEISPAVAYRLCAIVEQKKRVDSDRLLEEELRACGVPMPETTNNVLIIVEDLP